MSNPEALQPTPVFPCPPELSAARHEVSDFYPSDTAEQSSMSAFRLLRQRLGRIGLALGVLTGGAISAEALMETPAAADTAMTLQVYGTGGEGLYLHPDAPGLSTRTSDLLPDGANFDVSCWTTSDSVFGDTIWLNGTNEATGNTGYLSDEYINSPVTTTNEGPQLTALGIPECGSTPSSTTTPAPEGLQPAASLPPFISLDRNAEANWALAHAEDPPMTVRAQFLLAKLYGRVACHKHPSGMMD